MPSARDTKAINISSPILGSTNGRLKISETVSAIGRWLVSPRHYSVRPTVNPISVVCISDTHNAKPLLPSGDILLHAGDLSQYGTFDEIQAQLNWLNSQPHKHKIVIAGNHDLLLDTAFVQAHPDRELDRPGKSYHDLKWGNVVYLQDTSVIVKVGQRSLSIYGSPRTPRCGSFAFQHESTEDVWTNKIPSGTDILLTHGSPAAHLDHGKGCEYFLSEIWRVRPALVVFGHVHAARGQEIIHFTRSYQAYESMIISGRSWLRLPKLVILTLLDWCRDVSTTPVETMFCTVVNAAHNADAETSSDRSVQVL